MYLFKTIVERKISPEIVKLAKEMIDINVVFKSDMINFMNKQKLFHNSTLISPTPYKN